VNLIVCPFVLGPVMTKRCVQSALAQDIGDVEVLAIDNGAEDGTGVLIRSMPVLYWYRNQGLHVAWNEALRWAFEHLHLPYVLVINNDIVMRKDMFRLLVEDGGLFVTGVGVGNLQELGVAQPNDKSPHPSFSCFLIRREVWEKVGKFDETMRVYAGDGDYHLRMDAARIDAYAISVPFYHEVSGTLKNASPVMREAICKQADQDRATFAAKWGCAIGSEEYYARFRHARENLYEKTGRLA